MQKISSESSVALLSRNASPLISQSFPVCLFLLFLYLSPSMISSGREGSKCRCPTKRGWTLFFILRKVVSDALRTQVIKSLETDVLEWCFSRCGPGPSSRGITWELVGHAVGISGQGWDLGGRMWFNKPSRSS